MALTCSARKETVEGEAIDGADVGEGSKTGQNDAAVIGLREGTLLTELLTWGSGGAIRIQAEGV